jgi:hypothetical protein
MRIATLPVGYGDGYHRALSGKAKVLIGGKRCRVLGRVCMDQIMVDVSHLPEEDTMPGAPVVLLGRQGEESITAEDLAMWAGTISYEMLMAATARVPIYYQERMEKLTLRRGQYLVMVSDGVGEAEALRCCTEGVGKTPGEIAVSLITAGETEGQDDTTVVIISLEPNEN